MRALLSDRILFVAAFFCANAAFGRNAVKLKVAEPVLEELMGGCSMRCTFPWTVEVEENEKASSTKVLNDEKPSTAWIARDAASGQFVFRFSFPKRLPREMEGQVPFYGVDVINGHWASEDLWEKHARARKARVLYNGQVLGEIQFANTRRWQRLTFPDIMVRSGDVLAIEVLSIYPGKGGGLALSEVVLQGAH